MQKVILILGLIGSVISVSCPEVTCKNSVNSNGQCEQTSGGTAEFKTDMYDCDAGKYCMGFDSELKMMTCIYPNLAPGTKVSDGKQCASGVASGGKCTATASKGGACTGDIECPLTTYCNSGTKTCETQIAEGEPCGTSMKCQTGLICAGAASKLCVKPFSAAASSVVGTGDIRLSWACSTYFADPETGKCVNSWVKKEVDTTWGRNCQIDDALGNHKEDDAKWDVISQGDCRSIPSGKLMCKLPPSQLATQYGLVKDFVNKNLGSMITDCHVYYQDYYYGFCNGLNQITPYEDVFKAMMEILYSGTIEYYPTCVQKFQDPIIAKYYGEEEGSITTTIWIAIGITGALFVISLLLAIFIKF